MIRYACRAGELRPHVPPFLTQWCKGRPKLTNGLCIRRGLHASSSFVHVGSLFPPLPLSLHLQAEERLLAKVCVGGGEGKGGVLLLVGRGACWGDLPNNVVEEEGGG